MASTIVETPDLLFGFYYAQIISALIASKRVNIPELTDEDPRDPSIQILRAFANVGHNNSAVMDVVAQESVLSTARLVESVREHLRLIGYQLSPALPAKVEVVCQLSKVLTVAKTIVPITAQFSTARDPDTGITIFFEADNSVSANPTNALTSVLAVESSVFTDFTAKANSIVTPGDDWSPWANPNAGDILYFGHDTIMFNRIDTFATTDTEDGGFGVWEYFSGDFVKASPDIVEQVGSKLRMVVNEYLGSENRNGTEIRVQVNSTTVSEDVIVVWNGSQNVIETSGLLGQSVVSLDAGDYSVGSAWEALPSLTSSSGNGDLFFGINDDQVSWQLPQTVTDKWVKTTLESVEAFWIRFRWIESPPAPPVIQYVTIEDADQFVIVTCTQGQTSTDSPLGSSTGAPNQRFEATQSNYISSDDELLVDAVQWTLVENFILSGPQDEHYAIELTGDNDTPFIVFGDGIRGKIPAVGVSNIEWTYRFDASEDGNVGSSTVIVDRTGLSNVASVFNPRLGFGWSAAQGSTDESLALAKELGPATLRIKDVALNAGDVAELAVRFTDDSGAQPYSRAFAVEEGFGPGTIELVIVQKGGGLATNLQLDELSLFFNGDKFAVPPVPSRIAGNTQVIATNYTPRAINVTAKVTTVEAIGEEIANRLRAVLNPEALKSDGITREWEFGSEVALSRLDFEIHGVSNSIRKVEITTPASDIALSFRQLPTAGAINVEIVSPT